jgi:hypothetical protein
MSDQSDNKNDTKMGLPQYVTTVGTDTCAGGYSINRYQITLDKYYKISSEGAVKVAGNESVGWMINDQHKIFRWSGINNQGWVEMPGSANDICVGADGSVFIIGTNVRVGGYGIYKWNGSSWIQYSSGAGIKVAGDAQGNPWVITSDNTVFQWAGSSWVQMPGAASEICITAFDGIPYIIGMNERSGGYGIYKWNGSDWTQYVSGAGIKIHVDSLGRVWVITNANTIAMLENNVWSYAAGTAREITGAFRIVNDASK